jgi:hypothetical protein
MQLLFGLVLTMLSAISIAVAGEPWEKALAGPLVKIVSGQMIYEEYELCRSSADEAPEDSQSIQVKTRGVAPAGSFISRDYFVALVAVLAASQQQEMADNCKSLGSPIGKADVEISIQMTKDGFQVEYKNARTGQSNAVTSRWQDIFAD